MSSAQATLKPVHAGQSRSFFRRLGEWLADWPNPIVVKELRQAVRGLTAPTMFLLYLVVQLVVIGFTLMSVAEQIWSESAVGSEVFWAMQVQLVITIVGLLPLYAGTRLFLERSDVNLDLMFITPLRPIWLVLGKLLAALVVGLLFFSASAPVMTMAYFLRGLDLFNAGLLLGLDVLAMMIAVQAALFVAAIPAPRAVSGLLGVGLVFGLFIGVAGLASGSYMLLSDIFLQREALLILFSAVALTLASGFILLFAATHALLSPPTSNRLMLFKIMLLVVPITYWLAMMGLVELVTNWMAMPPPDPNDWLIFLWLMERSIAIVSWLAWCIAVSERLDWNRRVLAQVPRTRWLRVILFPFYTGAANGLVLALLLTALSCLIRGLIVVSATWNGTNLLEGFYFDRRETLLEWEFIALLADGYVVAYALTALALRRYLESRRSKVVPGWVLLLLEVGVIAFVSLLLAVFAALLRTPERYLAFAFVFTPYPLFEVLGMPVLYQHERWEVYFASTAAVLTWLAIVGTVTFAWWLRQVRRFAPPPKPDASPTKTQLPAADQKLQEATFAVSGVTNPVGDTLNPPRETGNPHIG